MKKTFRLLLMVLPMLLGLASCVDNDDNAVGNESVQTEEIPEVTTPTDDQMAVKVTVNVPTAVLGTFDEGSTGAALVKRLPVVTDHIGPETKMVLVPGTMFNDASISPDDLDALVRLSLEGGYLAIERPTAQQIFNFGVLYAAKLIEMQQLQYEEMFDLSSETAAAAAARSQALERFQTRQANIREMAQTRAGGDDDLNKVQAEMVIYGPTAYFTQEPFNEEMTAYVHTEDGEGNTTEAQAVTAKTERTAYISGTLADAAADGLNAKVTDDEHEEQSAARRATTRAGGSAINDIMDASEEFTYNEAINWRSWSNSTCYEINRVNMIVRSWGVHNMESNKDYYYLKQNVTLRMGNERGNKIYWPCKEKEWYNATNYGDYDNWYGSFLSQYVTSMNLVGNGSIQLEAAKPDTDNNTSSTSVSIGSSSSTTQTTGVTWGGNFGMSGSGPSAGLNLGGSYSEGTTKGTSFSLSTSQTSKDLSVKKNTSGSMVTWTYKGTLPQFLQPLEGDGYYHYKHQIAADILTNDCDIANEVCWSVTYPSERYTFYITSQPQTAALLYSYKKGSKGNRPSKYEYTTTTNPNHAHRLLQPNRAMQKWRMSITVDEWAGAEVAGANEYLQDALRKQFPDLYVDEFTIADKSAESLDFISYIINYSKNVFGTTSNLVLLQNLAKSKGVKKFRIHWRNDKGVQAKDPFVVNVNNRVPQILWCKSNSTLYFVNIPTTSSLGDTWDGQTIDAVWDGYVVTNSPAYDYPAWLDGGYNYAPNKVTRVVIDKSFADVRPKSLQSWFYFKNLTTIEGIENLNTSEVTTMKYMFYGCKSLTSLNVDGFDMSKVNDVSSMFSGCQSLTTIYCSQTWNISNSNYLFSECDKLKGAVGFDASKINCSMANPFTGYFTMPEGITVKDIYIKDAQDNSENLKQYVGQIVNIRYSRSLQAKVGSDGDYTPTPYTVCLPYDLDLKSAITSGQTAVYTLAAVTGGQFVFKKLDVTKLTAGTPYVVVVNRGKISLSAKGVKIVTAEPSSSKVYTSVSDWQKGSGTSVGDWMGTFDQWDSDEALAWDAFALKTSNNTWDYFDTSKTATIPAFRAFLSSSSIEQKAYQPKYEE